VLNRPVDTFQHFQGFQLFPTASARSGSAVKQKTSDLGKVNGHSRMLLIVILKVALKVRYNKNNDG